MYTGNDPVNYTDPTGMQTYGPAAPPPGSSFSDTMRSFDINNSPERILKDFQAWNDEQLGRSAELLALDPNRGPEFVFLLSELKEKGYGFRLHTVNAFVLGFIPDADTDCEMKLINVYSASKTDEEVADHLFREMVKTYWDLNYKALSEERARNQLGNASGAAVGQNPKFSPDAETRIKARVNEIKNLHRDWRLAPRDSQEKAEIAEKIRALGGYVPGEGSAYEKFQAIEQIAHSLSFYAASKRPSTQSQAQVSRAKAAPTEAAAKKPPEAAPKVAKTPATKSNGMKQTEPCPPSSGFKIGKHGDMPTPRMGNESHHGIMSKWMSANFKNYKPNEAPAVLMPEENHNATRGVFNKWRATMEQKMGGSIDWTKITKEKMRMLSDQMFNAANVPTDVQLEYYQQFQNFQSTLTPN